MSKAFTKEPDAEAEERDAEADTALPGGRNYVTPRGLALLREELDRLVRVERPKVVEVVSWAAGNGDRSENGDYIYGKRRLREIDRRVRYLIKRIESAVLVDPARQTNRDQVFFGATVTYRDPHGATRAVKLVGVDEADLERGLVSWVSPIARALMKAEVGDTVEVRTPAGVDRIEVLEIAYDDPASGGPASTNG
ncbi:MAG: transcription elongation factor GreB [Rhodospirillaceae bacterium]|nr:transcription elongation factor GreB [Rhodospirillaceae bacterium]